MSLLNSEEYIVESSVMKLISEKLRISFLALQRLCFNFVCSSKEQKQFIHFGIGNGKTMLCVSLGIHFVLKEKKPVFIIGKSNYLVLRDEKNFEKLISSFKINVNVNQNSPYE